MKYIYKREKYKKKEKHNDANGDEIGIEYSKEDDKSVQVVVFVRGAMLCSSIILFGIVRIGDHHVHIYNNNK